MVVHEMDKGGSSGKKEYALVSLDDTEKCLHQNLALFYI